MTTNQDQNKDLQESIQKLNFMSICDMAESNANKIAIDKYNIEIMGDLAGGAFLTQLRYWFSPTTKKAVKGNTRVSIRREGKLWLAKTDAEWWDECCVTPKQVRRIKAKLIELKLVEIKLFKFQNAPTIHYHLDLERYCELYHNQRLMNYEKEIHEQENHDINNDSRRDSAQRAKSILPKGQNGFCPKGQNLNISSTHLTSSFNLEKHMRNVSFIKNEENEKKMCFGLTGKPLETYNALDNDYKASYAALVTLPPSKEGGALVNPVQALRMSVEFFPHEVMDGLKVLEEHIHSGKKIKNTGAYISWILKKGLKPESPNVKINRDFWDSIKNRFKKSSIKEHRDCIEVNDLEAFYFWMKPEVFKSGLSRTIRND